MNLVLDIGNSLIKAGIFKNNALIESFTINNKSIKNLKQILETKNIQYSIASNVSKNNLDLINLLTNNTSFFKFNDNLELPFKNTYKSKKTLGEDRIGLISNAAISFPNENVLVIDLGTCITYDFLDKKNKYLGGNISPGLDMRYRSLNNQTSNLPLLKYSKTDSLIGDNTKNSIHTGVFNGILGEINSFISMYEESFGKIRIILTGGNSKLLLNKIKNPIFADSNFLLSGLNYLIELNKKR